MNRAELPAQEDNLAEDKEHIHEKRELAERRREMEGQYVRHAGNRRSSQGGFRDEGNAQGVDDDA